MRTTWNGSLSFGLVSIPVGLAPATKPAARQSDVSFRLLHRECGTPIKQKRWCPVHDREVGPDELVKGWEVSKGQFVLVEESDLEALERSDDSRAIEITQFVRLEEVDPIFFDRTYFLVPGSAPAQRRPYVLLLEAMKESGAAALGRFVRSGRESLCLVRARGDALALETLFLAEDVHSQAEIDEATADADVKEQELQLARQVISSLEAPFEAAALQSEYRRDLGRCSRRSSRARRSPCPSPRRRRRPWSTCSRRSRASVAAATGGKPDGASGAKGAARPRKKAAAAARKAS